MTTCPLCHRPAAEGNAYAERCLDCEKAYQAGVLDELDKWVDLMVDIFGAFAYGVDTPIEVARHIIQGRGQDQLEKGLAVAVSIRDMWSRHWPEFRKQATAQIEAARKEHP